jgi:signal transduction histidine kinase
MAEEVELGGDGDDYEIVPLGPLRRLEKRLDQIEKEHEVGSGEAVVDDMLDILKSNQSLFNQLVETNVSLQEKIDDLLDELQTVGERMNDFLELLEAASDTAEPAPISETGETPPPAGGVTDKVDDTLNAVVESNQQMAESLEKLERRMKKLYTNQKTEEEHGVGLDVERSGAAELLADEEQNEDEGGE